MLFNVVLFRRHKGTAGEDWTGWRADCNAAVR